MLRGNGVDMYDLIPKLSEDNEELIPTRKIFWVGVVEGLCPSPPVPRTKTRCYTGANVYLYSGKLVFGMNYKNHNGEYSKRFYSIPENEQVFVQ